MTLLEAQDRLPELARRAHDGEEVILVAEDGEPFALRLEPLKTASSSGTERRLGALAHLGITMPESFFDPLPEEELRLWEGEED